MLTLNTPNHMPFKAKIEGNSDIKNYTEYLCDNAGEAIMKWMIEGAYQAIEMGFKFPFPKCVSDAIAAYKAEKHTFSFSKVSLTS